MDKVKRTQSGQFEKGCSGNPRGRPRGTDKKGKDRDAQLLEQASKAAILLLINTVTDREADLKLRLNAANDLLERAYGKPSSAKDAAKKEPAQEAIELTLSPEAQELAR